MTSVTRCPICSAMHDPIFTACLFYNAPTTVAPRKTAPKRPARKRPEDQAPCTFGNTPAALVLYDILNNSPYSIRANITRTLVKFNTIMGRLRKGDSVDRYIATTMIREACAEVDKKTYDIGVKTHANTVLKTKYKEWLRKHGFRG